MLIHGSHHTLTCQHMGMVAIKHAGDQNEGRVHMKNLKSEHTVLAIHATVHLIYFIKGDG